MRWILRILFGLVFGGIFIGFYVKNNLDFALGQKIIGFHVLGGVLIYLPIFLYHRWKGKSLKDYTLTPENLKRVKERSEVTSKRGKKNKSL